jgi:hypothetical protein
VNQSQHFQRVSAGIGWVVVREKRTDVAGRTGAQNGIRHGMADGVAVRVARQVRIEGDVHSTEPKWTTWRKTVTVVSDPGSDDRRPHAATVSGRMML